MNYQRERLELMVISTTSSNQIISEMFKIYQDKASMDLNLKEFNSLTSTCWNEKYQPLTIHMTKDKYIGRYRLGLNNIFVPDSSPF